MISSAAVGAPFAGLRIVDFSSMVSGPFCTKLFADLGAEVIKVEQPRHGDEARRRGPFPNDCPDPSRSLLFEYLNTHKLGITLNVEVDEGQVLFRELVQIADVCVEDKPPGYLESFGLGYQSLRRLIPQLIVLSITPFGQTGPYRNYKAYNLNTTHVGGEGWLTPSGLAQRLSPAREPLKAGGYIGDYYCGVTAATALITALLGSNSLGEGQHIDLSKQDAHMTLSRRALGLYANRGILETRETRDNLYGGVIPCKDGYFVAIILQQHQWEALAAMMGHPSWMDDPRFVDQAGRNLFGGEINLRLTQWAATKSKAEIYKEALQAGVPLGPVLSPTEVLESEQERARGYFADVWHPRLGRVRYPTAPYRLSATPVRIRQVAPTLGQHNTAVYCDLLGRSRKELYTLWQAGVI
ncbi:MAG: CoA transferase [Chloroflexi bacterium]|nr:CoA transferase [Chloroflexota bacterium]